MSNVYKTELKLLTEHCDINQNLRLSNLLKITQEASIAHTTELGMGRHMTLDRGFLWVIARQYYEIKRLPKYDEHITIETWPGKTMHFIFPRNYLIKDESGEVLIRASAAWALINKDTRKIVFPSKEGIHIDGEETKDDLALPILEEAPNFDDVKKFEVKYSQVDLNGHLNNASYIDILQDMIPIDTILKMNPVSFDLSYKKEIKLGETVEVNYAEKDNKYYFECPKFIIRVAYK